MASSVNKVILVGRLGENVKIQYFEGGNCIARFSLATNEIYTDSKTNEKITNTEWHQIVVRNKMAENCEKYLKKGDKVYCEGKIKYRKWEAKDGTKNNTTEIYVSDISFLTQGPVEDA
jgi:single-strand DNA-binding protein